MKLEEQLGFECARGGTYAVKHLLGQGVDPTWEDNLPIRFASQFGHLSIVVDLFKWKGADGKKVDPTALDHYAFRMATSFGKHKVAKALLLYAALEGEGILDQMLACSRFRSKVDLAQYKKEAQALAEIYKIYPKEFAWDRVAEIIDGMGIPSSAINAPNTDSKVTVDKSPNYTNSQIKM